MLRQTRRKMLKKKLQENLEEFVKNSDELMNKFIAKSIQGTAYLEGKDEKKMTKNLKTKLLSICLIYIFLPIN